MQRDKKEHVVKYKVNAVKNRTNDSRRNSSGYENRRDILLRNSLSVLIQISVFLMR